jgi:hypothetical protein
LASVLLAAALTAGAQPSGGDINKRREEARRLADEGFALHEQGRYDEAIQKFREAERNVHSPLFQVFEARAHVGRGRLVEAVELLKKVIDEPLPEYAPESFWQAKGDAKKDLASLEPRVPKVQIVLDGEQLDGAEVTFNGKPVPGGESPEPVLANPGTHRVSVRLADGRAVDRTVTVSEGETVNARLDLGTPISGPPVVQLQEGPDEGGPSYVLPGILFGVGGASLLVGIITGGVFVGKAGELKDRCPDNQCAPEDEEEGDSVATLGNVSTATLVIGAVGIVAGTIFLFVPLGEDDPAETSTEAEVEASAPQLRLGIGSIGIDGRF